MDPYFARGGGAGWAFGPGRVYVMEDTASNSYKIGCTSREPETRLQEIRRGENNQNINLVSSVKANEMNSAETAAQRAVQRMGLVKDPSRGGATDWHNAEKGSTKPEEVSNAVKHAVYGANRRHNKWLSTYQNSNIWNNVDLVVTCKLWYFCFLTTSNKFNQPVVWKLIIIKTWKPLKTVAVIIVSLFY